MKRIFICALGAWVWAAGALGQAREVRVSVRNNSETDRAFEPVAVNLKSTKALRHLGWEVKDVELREAKSGERVSVQLDDMDGDRKADEVFFLANVKAGKKKTYVMKLKGKKNAEGKQGEDESFIYTALQLRDKAEKHPDMLRVETAGSSNVFNDIYMHGMTVESDLVGYRIYFDHRQNIDLYGKRKKRIELPITQFYTSAEQLKEGYGVDVLWAGGAIGCGSLKDWRGGKAENWTDVAVRGQRIVTSGALRTVVEMYDLGVDNGKGGTFDMRQRYTLCAHHRDLMVEVCLDGAKDKVLCTGVQKVGTTADEKTRKGHESMGFVKADGLAASWGCDFPDMGKKSIWTPEAVGLAVYVPKKHVTGTQEDELNYLVKMKSDCTGKLKYWVSFCAEMEEEGVKTGGEWMKEAERWKANLEDKVKVRVR